MFTGIVQTVGVIESRLERPGGVRMLVRPMTWPRTAEPGESICVSGVCLTHAPSAEDAASVPAGSDAAASGGSATQLLAFDIIRETLDKSMLGDLGVGDQVNLEPSLRADSLIAGHFVQGHVDGCGRVVEVRDQPEEWRIRIEAPMALRPYLIPKGSISIDGVSLTVAALDAPTPGTPGTTPGTIPGTTPGTTPGNPAGAPTSGHASASLGVAGGTESAKPGEEWFGFEVALIPTTLELTTLGQRLPGDRVNLEADAMAKTIVQWLELRMGTPGTTPGMTPGATPGIPLGTTPEGISGSAPGNGPENADSAATKVDSSGRSRQEGVSMDLLRKAGFDDKPLTDP